MPKQSSQSKVKATGADQRKPSRSKAKLIQRRAWHLRISLHPVSIMTVLCVGVFLIASTIATFGDSYTVDATVPGTIPTTAAFINDPSDNTHVNSESITITGSCPTDSSYVSLNVNGSFAGASSCDSNAFVVSVLLQPGANQINVQDYNDLNQPGPSSPAITVTYDQPVDTPITTSSSDIVAPIALQVDEVDISDPYVSLATIEDTSNLPTFQGIAPPYSQVTLVLHSNPTLCQTTANGVGYWQCTIPTALPFGYHTVKVTAVTVSGQNLSLPLFRIHVTAMKVASTATVKSPVVLSTSYQYQVYLLNQQMAVHINLSGGVAPYNVSINWGDGDIQTVIEASSGPVTVSHSYSKTSSALDSFPIKIQVVDAANTTAATQLIAIIRNPQYVAPTTNSSKNNQQSLLADVHSWLWILWPGYAIVVLMLISFWLGERKQYGQDSKRKTPKKLAHHRRAGHHA